MSAERPTIGINHPDQNFTKPLQKALLEKGIDSATIMKTENSYNYTGLDALILQAQNGFEVPENIVTVIIDEPTSEKLRSEWASHYLDEGAVGYFPHDEHPKFIAAFMKNLLQRGTRSRKEKENGLLVFEDLTVDERRRLAQVGDSIVDLRRREFDLLAFLVRNPETIFTREQMLEEVWGYDYLGESRTVDIHAEHLRKKLKEKRSKANIKTVRGVGYGLVRLDKNEGEEVEKLK